MKLSFPVASGSQNERVSNKICLSIAVVCVSRASPFFLPLLNSRSLSHCLVDSVPWIPTTYSKLIQIVLYVLTESHCRCLVFIKYILFIRSPFSLLAAKRVLKFMRPYVVRDWFGCERASEWMSEWMNERTRSCLYSLYTLLLCVPLASPVA